MRRPRIILADDQVSLQQAITRLLRPTCDVIGTVADGGEILKAIEQLQPDVVVVDMNMPNLNGIEACRRIRAAAPAVKVIILTALDDPEIRRLALQVGAAGFVAKMDAADDLATAIENAFTQ